MTDFLLELLSEEIPARMQDKAREDLARLFAAEIGKAGLSATAIETYATPRRLALIARGLPDATEAVSEEVKGPRADAPAQALAGFLGKTGLTREQLVERTDAKGNAVLFAVIEKPGRATAEVLAEAIPAVIRAFPWPKSMRWGAASRETTSLRWVRPLQGIVALFGEAVVPVEIDGIAAGAATVGHRFHHPGVITIGSAADYAVKLRAAHVIVDQDERREIIRTRAGALAAEAGLTVVEDEGLVAENAGLTEWPVPLLGRFDPDFLTVPPEVIQLTARVNQKYFVCRDRAGALADAFICTANIDAADGGAKIVEGNRKVLAARLSDARFFYETDLKTRLEDQLPRLEKIVFHEKLGTVADKVDRVAKLARWLVEEGIVGASSPLPFKGGASSQTTGLEEAPHPNPSPEGEGLSLADMAERAARLAKADLVTGMVGEFPELQGLMGGYYAKSQGEPREVWEAVRDHYKPVGQGDDVPTAPVTVAVSLADKLDSLGRFFAIEEIPTGSKDPYALRRSALSILKIIRSSKLKFNIHEAITAALYLGLRRIEDADASSRTWRPIYSLNGFFVDRLRQMLRDEGRRFDLVNAVVVEGEIGFDVNGAIAACMALQEFLETEDGRNLLAGYKRAANILRIEEGKDKGGFAPTAALAYDPLPEEAALLAALDRAETAATAAVEAEDFAGAMRALAALRAPIDGFFDKVTVNDADPAKRAARLGLLVRIRDAVHRVADFSKIEG